MHQQPPRPHQEGDAVEAEPSSPSRPGTLDALRYSKAGSMIGHPLLPLSATATPEHPGLESKLPARFQVAAQQQEGSILEPVTAQGEGHGVSLVRFPPTDQTATALPVQAQDQQLQSNELWSASAHLQAVELLLDAAQHTSSSPQLAVQHLQSISLLCQSCMGCLSSVQAAGRAAAPLQSMQSMCDSATEEALKQAHAQHALWVSLRLLCRTVVQALNS